MKIPEKKYSGSVGGWGCSVKDLMGRVTFEQRQRICKDVSGQSILDRKASSTEIFFLINVGICRSASTCRIQKRTLDALELDGVTDCY